VEPENDATVDPEAPDSISDLLDGFWLGWEAEPGGLDALVAAFPDIVDPEPLLAGHRTGGQRPFTSAHQAVVDLYPPPDDDGSWSRPDPAAATPAFLVNRYRCDLDQLARILVHLDQDALYNAYDAYTRRYTTDFGAWERGERDDVAWEVDLTASGFGLGSYDERLLGGVRRLPIPDDVVGDFPMRELLVARTWIPYPARGSQIDFRQDYQLEIYVPWGEGEILHLYGLWRELTTGFGSFADGVVQTVTLSNLVSWDETTERLCAEGRP
jgi:hypothetical protein